MSTSLLGDFVDIKTGKLDANAAVDDGKYPFFTCAREASWINTAAFDADAVLVAGNGDLNVKHYVGKFNAYQRTYVIQSKDQDKLDTRFLFHFMDRYVETLRRQSIGGVIKYIKLGNLTDAPLPIFNIEKQRRIAAILDKADAIRRKREQALALADDFLRTTFLDMFGDLEINPLDWATKCLGELITLSPQNGLYKPSTDYGSGTSILRIDSFYDGYLNRNCKFKKVRINDHEISKYRLNERDIVINRVNSKSHLGKSALIDSLVETTVFESNMMRFSTNEELILPRFMVDQIQSNYVKRQILSKARDSVNQSSINQEDVCNLMIRVPNLNLQNKYIEVVEKNLSNKHSTIRALEQAGGLIKSLSQLAFSGEL